VVVFVVVDVVVVFAVSLCEIGEICGGRWGDMGCVRLVGGCVRLYVLN
jgi:hypothetical protein